MASQDEHKFRAIPSRESLLNGEFSDIVIRCGEVEFRAHRAILSLASGYFAAACKENFAEGVSGVIDLSAHDAGDIHLVVGYIYGKRYKAPGKVLAAAYHAHAYAIADYFEVPDLRMEASTGFEEIFMIGKVGDVEKGLLAAAEVYSENCPALRKVLVKGVCRFPAELLRDTPETRRLFEQVPDLAVDIAFTLAQTYSVPGHLPSPTQLSPGAQTTPTRRLTRNRT